MEKREQEEGQLGVAATLPVCPVSVWFLLAAGQAQVAGFMGLLGFMG